MNYTFEDIEAIRREAQQELENEIARWGFTDEVSEVKRYHVMAVLRVRDRIIRPQPQADLDELPLGVSSLGEVPAPELLRLALPEPESATVTKASPEEPKPLDPPEPEPSQLSLKLAAKKISATRTIRTGKPARERRAKRKQTQKSAHPFPRAEVEQRWVERAEMARKILLERPMPVPLRELAAEVMGRIPAGQETRRLVGTLRELLGDRLILSGKGTRNGPIMILLSTNEPPALGRQESLNPKQPSSVTGRALEGERAEQAQAPPAKTRKPALPVERLPEGGFIRPVEPSSEIKAMLERMAAGRASAAERARMLISSGFRPEFKDSKPRTPSRLTELAQKLFADLGYDRPGESFAEGSTGHQDWLRCLEKARKIMQSESEMVR